MKILTIIGARPQFIKASVVSRAIKNSNKLEEVILHTGQHFDENMSNVFFNQLEIPRPKYSLSINGGTHGLMTGRMIIEIEPVLMAEKPDMVMVYGDTNSTLAGALAAVKLHIPICHVEAGLRSGNMRMPEEVNRILTDQLSSILFCPTDTAVSNLEREGFKDKAVNVLKVGDVMQDATLLFKQAAKKTNFDDNFILSTIHRAENTDDPAKLKEIIKAINELHSSIAPVIMPLHPRTRLAIENLVDCTLIAHVIEPVGYLEMLALLDKSALVLTDSGGVQKEAYFFKKPCVTVRDQTEWVELVEINANELVQTYSEQIVSAVERGLLKKIIDDPSIYGGGQASRKIVSVLESL